MSSLVPSAPVIDVSDVDLTAAFGSDVVRFDHDLHLTSLTTEPVDAIATSLATDWFVASDADVPFGAPRSGAMVNEDRAGMVHRVADDRWSLRLYHLEHLPIFRVATDTMSAIVARLSPDDVVDVGLALFLAPVAAVTPAHPDRHHNLLFQIEGTKRVWVEDLTAGDPLTRHRRLVEYFRRPGAGAPDLPPAQVHDVGPGDALYIPATAYHWTEVTSDARSLALSVGFATEETRRVERISNFDATLHRFGWRSRPAGPAKRTIVDALDAVRRRRAGT